MGIIFDLKIRTDIWSGATKNGGLLVLPEYGQYGRSVF